MNNIIGFVRTSTMKQGNSIKLQREKIKEYAKDRNLQLVDIIEEEGVSGDKLNRAGYDTIMDMVNNKRVDGVVCYWLSRAGRNAVRVLQLINSCLENNVILMSVKEGIDTSTSGGRMMAKFYAVLAEEELITIRERIKGVIRHKKRNGLQYNGTPAYGTYVKNGLLYEDEFEIKIVRNMKNLRSRGWSWYKIKKHLNINDIQTKEGGEKGWHIPQVQRAYNFHYNNDNKPSLIKY